MRRDTRSSWLQRSIFENSTDGVWLLRGPAAISPASFISERGLSVRRSWQTAWLTNWRRKWSGAKEGAGACSVTRRVYQRPRVPRRPTPTPRIGARGNVAAPAGLPRAAGSARGHGAGVSASWGSACQFRHVVLSLYSAEPWETAGVSGVSATRASVHSAQECAGDLVTHRKSRFPNHIVLTLPVGGLR